MFYELHPFVFERKLTTPKSHFIDVSWIWRSIWNKMYRILPFFLKDEYDMGELETEGKSERQFVLSGKVMLCAKTFLRFLSTTANWYKKGDPY